MLPTATAVVVDSATLADAVPSTASGELPAAGVVCKGESDRDAAAGSDCVPVELDELVLVSVHEDVDLGDK